MDSCEHVLDHVHSSKVNLLYSIMSEHKVIRVGVKR